MEYISSFFSIVWDILLSIWNAITYVYPLLPWSGWIAVIVIILILKSLNERKKEKAEFESYYKLLLETYNDDEDLVKKIIAGEYWQGQTSEMLRDSLGVPEDIDSKVLKSKKKEIWKYIPAGKGRYDLKIILENDIVVGWED